MELELWKKGQLAADEDEENEDPSAILTTEDLGECFQIKTLITMQIRFSIKSL